MIFKEFAKRLHDVIGAGNNTSIFTKSLFASAVTDLGSDILDTYKIDTFKSYYNGTTSIAKLAQKITVYLAKDEFILYLEEFEDETAQSLCSAFEDVLPNIDLFNYSEQIADLFIEIITTAAATTRKTPAKKSSMSSTKKTNDDVIIENLSKPLLMFADALEANKQAIADKIRSNNEEDHKNETESVEAEVVDDDISSGAAEENKKITVIHHQTNVIQNGDHSVNMTNNGTINFNF